MSANVISYEVPFYIISCMFIAFIIFVIYGMKDVINEKQFDIRRERSNSIETNKRMIYVLK